MKLNMTAEQIVKFIATDQVELSQDKIAWQRDAYIKMCRDWLTHKEKGLTDE